MARPTRLCRAWVLLLAATVRADQSPGNDHELIQGTWAVVALEQGGHVTPRERLRDRVVEIQGNRFTHRAGERIYSQGEFTLRPTRSPKAVDLLFTLGANKGRISPGIYELDGDTLRVCTTEPGDDRPTAFRAKPGTALSLFVLKRQKP